MENGGLASETKDVHSCLCFTELVQLRGDPYLLHLHLPSRHSPGRQEGGRELGKFSSPLEKIIIHS